MASKATERPPAPARSRSLATRLALAFAAVALAAPDAVIGTGEALADDVRAGR